MEKKSEERDEKIEERVTKLEGDHDSRISNLEERLSSVQASGQIHVLIRLSTPSRNQTQTTAFLALEMVRFFAFYFSVCTHV